MRRDEVVFAMLPSLSRIKKKEKSRKKKDFLVRPRTVADQTEGEKERTNIYISTVIIEKVITHSCTVDKAKLYIFSRPIEYFNCRQPLLFSTSLCFPLRYWTGLIESLRSLSLSRRERSTKRARERERVAHAAKFDDFGDFIVCIEIQLP